MRERPASLNEQLEREFGVRLQTRIGVNTGEVVTGEAASGSRLATGDAVNVAAWLEQAAQPGEILLGEQTAWLARTAIEVAPVEPLALKGKAKPKPHPAYRLLRLLEGRPPFDRRLDTPFAGRRSELERIDRRLDTPFAGRRSELERIAGAFKDALSDRCGRLVTTLGSAGIPHRAICGGSWANGTRAPGSRCAAGRSLRAPARPPDRSLTGGPHRRARNAGGAGPRRRGAERHDQSRVALNAGPMPRRESRRTNGARPAGTRSRRGPR
jgi:Adenylate and Guanylate cyclase catalytic domain